MAAPVYKAFLVRLTEAWYQLTPEEQDVVVKGVDAAREQVGGKTILLCDSSWSSEQWPTFGVEVFPSLEALQKHTALLTDVNWFRYIDSISVVGSDPATMAALMP